MSWTVPSEREEVTELSQICHIDDRSLSFEGGGGTVVWVVTSVFLKDLHPGFINLPMKSQDDLPRGDAAACGYKGHTTSAEIILWLK